MNTSISIVADPNQMYETENDIPLLRRTALNVLMNQRLASAIDLQLQLKQAHWNVKGPNFIGLHELFDKVSEAIEPYVDMIAERIVQLGGTAEGTIRGAANRSRLTEYPSSIGDGSAHVDAVTADLFTEVTRGIDKWLWFVEAHHQATK
jgi:starvation-inducible DNA-binding protein